MSAFRADELEVRVFADGHELARAAATDAAAAIVAAVDQRDRATVMFASGNSQVAFLDALIARGNVPWNRVTGFHMDEYVGMNAEHPASFARYMREHIIDRVDIAAFHLIDGTNDPGDESARYSTLLADNALDLCCLGVGENGHLAFNDPPYADFDDPLDAKEVALDDASRHQQVGEGHFATLDAVPRTAVTVTIPALLRAHRVLAVVPEVRKAAAVQRALTGPIEPACPASILRRTTHATLYLDEGSATYISNA